MSLSAPGPRRILIWLHRWLGVGLCIVLAVWFASGFVMMYSSFPEIERSESLANAGDIEADLIQLTAEEAFANLPGAECPDRVLLTAIDHRPAYRFFIRQHQRIVYADNGAVLANIPPETARQIAAAWTHQPADQAHDDGLIREPDQWTVNGIFRRHGPLLKYSWPNGEEAYVSTRSAEMVQRTTRSSRIAAYFGAIPHWLYFTPLRRNGAVWTRTVIWLSAFATFLSLSGIIAGVWIYSPRKGYRIPGGRKSFPYSGQKYLHAVFGLIFGLAACTWAFSGMLSMDPFPELSSGGRLPRRLTDPLSAAARPLAGFSEQHPREVLKKIYGWKPKEVELLRFDGKSIYLAAGDSNRSILLPVNADPTIAFDSKALVGVLSRLKHADSAAEIREITGYEPYYVDRHHRLPLPVLFVGYRESSGYYIDPRTAAIVKSYAGAAERWNRWLYHGLHSIDLPWLYRHRPAWDVTMLVLLLGGASIVFTGLILSWRVLIKGQ